MTGGRARAEQQELTTDEHGNERRGRSGIGALAPCRISGTGRSSPTPGSALHLTTNANSTSDPTYGRSVRSRVHPWSNALPARVVMRGSLTGHELAQYRRPAAGPCTECDETPQQRSGDHPTPGGAGAALDGRRGESSGAPPELRPRARSPGVGVYTDPRAVATTGASSGGASASVRRRLRWRRPSSSSMRSHFEGWSVCLHGRAWRARSVADRDERACAFLLTGSRTSACSAGTVPRRWKVIDPTLDSIDGLSTFATTTSRY